MRRLILFMTLCVASLLFAQACRPSSSSAAAPASTATVIVRNESWDLMRVYVSLDGDYPTRLGAVDAQTRAAFRLRPVPSVMYRFIVVPLAGSTRYTISDALTIVAGDTVVVTIASYVPFSSAVKR